MQVSDSVRISCFSFPPLISSGLVVSFAFHPPLQFSLNVAVADLIRLFFILDYETLDLIT